MAGTTTTELTAIVARVIRYGEADLIAHLLTLEEGRAGVIAKGARRQKSRLGARLDPLLVVRVQAGRGRGDLAYVRGVEVVEAPDAIRSSYARQQLALALVDLAYKLGHDGSPEPEAWHLVRRFLQVVEGLDDSGLERDEREARDVALLAAAQLKLLHAGGMAPGLGACIRCGAADGLVAWSPADGGVTCADCRQPGDIRLEPDVHAAAVELTRTPLAEVAAGTHAPGVRVARLVSDRIVAPLCEHQAGVRPRRP